MHPSVAIITNIEADHLDCYRDLDDIKDAFVAFANKVPGDGAVIACLDDEGVRDVLPRLRSPVVTYGLAGAAQFRAERAPAPAARQAMRVLQSGRLLGTVELRVPGEHNIRNALAAIAAAMQAGASFEVVQQAAATFTGVKRRLEFVGEAGGVTVIDDYAHHPSEVRASLAALRGMKYRRVLVGFQPHLYTRTRDFMDGFVESLAEADVLAVMDIYAAREAPIVGVSSHAIVDGISRRGHGAVCHAADRDELVAALLAAALPGDVVVLMGAGDIWRAATPILKGLADAAARRG
jgi:UDP-N-acetylmuramate--alanine ligase